MQNATHITHATRATHNPETPVINLEGYQNHLNNRGLSGNTIRSYVSTVQRFSSEYGEVTRESLSAYREYLVSERKGSTANQHMQALNSYLDYVGYSDLRLRTVKQLRHPYLENMISDTDYRYLRDSLFRDGRNMYGFAVWVMAATGARVSELLQLEVEHVQRGYADMCSKGGRIRRLYIPATLQRELMKWIASEHRVSGYLFLNHRGERITARGLSLQLKRYGIAYGLDPAVVHPHAFRHLFAKNFLDAREDIALLADLMGHASIETTRAYLRRTALEQRSLVDSVVTW